MGDAVKGFVEFQAETMLCSDSIWTHTHGFLTPDATKAYMEVYLSHSLPTIMAFGNALHPQTVANSYQSMLHQIVNIGHMVRSYAPDDISRDKIVGSVVHVEFPQLSENSKRWAVNMKDSPPAIRAVLSIGKQAAGIDKIIGGHQSGRKKWSVSMEYNYAPDESGFLVPSSIRSSSGLLQLQDTPQDIREAGYYYVPMTKAPEDMRSCWMDGRMKKKWREENLVYLQGGPGGYVHYFGIGLTETPAEPTAQITKMLASKADPEMESLLSPLRVARDVCEKLVDRIK